jgi:hypothetical protein
MDIEQALIVQESFQALSYDKQLRYWDANGIYFLYVHHQLAPDVSINIEPYNGGEHVAYNKWIVGHWRSKFLLDLPSLGSKDLTVLKSFDDYVAVYRKLLEHKTQEDVLESEIPRVSASIVSMKASRRILRLVYNSINNFNENGIYSVKAEASSIFIELKQIAKVLDLVKYLVFLKRQRGVLEKNEDPPFRPCFTIMSDMKVNTLYDSLILHKFIDEDTDKVNFIKLLKNEQVNSDFRIIWIDKAPRNKVVNKLTLLEFIYGLVLEQTREMNSLLVKHFSILSDGKQQLISRDMLKGSWSRLNKKEDEKKSDRQKLILKIIA